jgi:3-phenylpropionate/trans-cinnamate dioxygenase ferredoxin reductase subunit
MTRRRAVIVGAGHAGGTAAAQLRSLGWDGEVVLVGDEPLPPYQRPPLSKEWLTGESDVEALKLKSDRFYAERDIALLLNARVEAIDRPARRIAVAGDERLSFSHLVLATGARPRKLVVPGAELPHVLELRSASDASLLKQALGPGSRLAIIGGGYIGLEVAASARTLGAEVVVVERESRVLERVACRPLAEFFERYHRARGVEIITDAEVEALEPAASGHVAHVQLRGGRRLGCDAALVGVGVEPNDELARAAELPCRDGILVDEDGRTEDPAIFAIGDVARRPLPRTGDTVRLESVPNALDQAKRVAAAVCGAPPGAGETPWFWSDQFDLKLQIAGLQLNGDRTVLRGSMEEGSFALFHLEGDLIQAVEAVNAPLEFVIGRQLISEGRPVSRERLVDTAVPMKQVAAEA